MSVEACACAWTRSGRSAKQRRAELDGAREVTTGRHRARLRPQHPARGAPRMCFSVALTNAWKQLVFRRGARQEQVRYTHQAESLPSSQQHSKEASWLLPCGGEKQREGAPELSCQAGRRRVQRNSCAHDVRLPLTHGLHAAAAYIRPPRCLISAAHHHLTTSLHPTMSDLKNVVIVGASSGAALARQLEKKLPSSHRIVSAPPRAPPRAAADSSRRCSSTPTSRPTGPSAACAPR